ncbi:type II secretion system F family protein [Kineococcus sp. NUM-3379]
MSPGAGALLVAVVCAAAVLALPAPVADRRLRSLTRRQARPGAPRSPRSLPGARATGPVARAVERVRAALRAGHAPDADLLLAAGLAERLAALLRAGIAPVAAWRHAAGACGLPTEVAQALAAAVGRGEDVGPVLRRAGARGTGPVAASWMLAQRCGAPAADVLARCGTALRETADARAAVRSALAGPQASARVVSALPLLGLLLGAALGASPWTVLLGTWPGRACAVAGVALALAARSWSGHLVRQAGAAGTARAPVRP